MDKWSFRHAYKLWLHYGVFWMGAVVAGLVAVLYARLTDYGYNLFLAYVAHDRWLPLVVTPVVSALCVWITRRFFEGAEGSGIPQVIAALHGPRELGQRLLTIPILVGKILVSFRAILGGLTIGREGPTIHVGATLMFSLRQFYPARFRAISGASLERKLALAGAAAGLSAAFNTPLAGVVFAIEELTRSFEQRTSGVLITAIIFAGVVSLGLQGQSSITAFVIVIGMINGHALVISLMATALIASRVSRFFAPPLYEALSERYTAGRHGRA
ncbi:Chloride channel protein [Paraburkholderia kururiensis]